jgi:hypothetical protein
MLINNQVRTAVIMVARVRSQRYKYKEVDMTFGAARVHLYKFSHFFWTVGRQGWPTLTMHHFYCDLHTQHTMTIPRTYIYHTGISKPREKVSTQDPCHHRTSI